MEIDLNFIKASCMLLSLSDQKRLVGFLEVEIETAEKLEILKKDLKCSF